MSGTVKSLLWEGEKGKERRRKTKRRRKGRRNLDQSLNCLSSFCVFYLVLKELCVKHFLIGSLKKANKTLPSPLGLCFSPKRKLLIVYPWLFAFFLFPFQTQPINKTNRTIRHFNNRPRYLPSFGASRRPPETSCAPLF